MELKMYNPHFFLFPQLNYMYSRISPSPYTHSFLPLSFSFAIMYIWKHGKIKGKNSPHSAYHLSITDMGGESRQWNKKH